LCILWTAFPAFSQVPEGDPSVENAAAEAVSVPDSAGTGRGPPARSAEEALFSFDDQAPTSPAANPASAFSILRMILVLALVALLIYLVIFFLRRLSRPPAEQNPHLRILASAHLGGGRYVHILTVGSKAWLVGSAEGGVSSIAEITEKEAVDAMILDLSQKSAEERKNPVLNFQAMLKRFSASTEDRLEKLRERRERFKRF
jgi:flagellar protein FliO/FliZ